MRRLLLLAALMFAALPAFAQVSTTSVSGTISDANGQAFASGSWSAVLIAASGGTGQPFVCNGITLTSAQVQRSGSLDSSGAFTATMVSNSCISPSGSLWQFTFVPASTSAPYTQSVFIFGSTQSLTSTITPPAIVVNNSAVFTIAYTDAEVFGFKEGSFYWNVITPALRVYHSGAWQGIGGGGGGGVTSFTGDGTLISNSASTGAVTATLGNAAQNSVFAGPATGGAGAPSYQTAPTFSAANLTSFPTFNQSTTGNAATATALAATPTLCSTGQAPTGILPSGNATGCASLSSGSVTTSGSPANTYLSYFTAPTVVSGNSGATEDTSGNVTALSLATTGGANPGLATFPGNTGTATIGTNLFGILGPSSATFTSYALQFPTTAPATATPLLSCNTPTANISTCSFVAASGGSAFPVTVTGGVSGAVPCFTSTTTEAAGTLLTANVLVKGGGAGVCPSNSLITDNGTTATYTGTGGYVAPILVTNGTGAGAAVLTQGAAQGHATANTLTVEAPAAVTAYEIVLPGTAATGIVSRTNASNVDTESIDANATVTAGALSLGASGTVGTVALGNATSGTVTLGTVAGALGAVTASLPANTGTIAETNLAQTFSAAQTYSAAITNSVAGVASVPGVNITGAPFAGTATTSFPQLYMNTTGAAAVTTFSTSGSYLGINTASGFAGNLISFHVNGGGDVFKVTSAGTPFVTGLTNNTSGHVVYSSTAPVIGTCGTGPSIVANNGTWAFTVNVGTGGTASTCTVTMPTATTGWSCMVAPNGAPQAAAVTYSAPTSTTLITLTNYTQSTGVALAWTASTVLNVNCTGY
jgi:hypothetical protein